ncbi:MAG TPA: hypothetical protein VHO68_03090, partial [Bacteroidales bacterium]|nr:hypothetical protein [Bacteroidales bacterium]
VQDPTKAIIDELEKIAGEEKEVREEYGIFLTDVLHLNGVLSFEAADKVLTLVNELKKKIFERDQAAENARSKKKFIDGFEEIIGKFTGIVQFESEEPVLRARQILREYSHDVQISGEKTKLRERIDAMKLNLRRTEEKLTVISEKIDSLLTSAGATGREDFRKKYETNSRVAKLLEAKKSELLTIEKIAGKGNGDKLLKFWMENDREAIANQFMQLSNELKKKNEDFKNNKESIGSQKQHLEQIEDQSSVAEQMTIIETEKKKLVAEYHNWIANKLAYKILSDVRGKFEREQQPEVIRNTSGLFSKITNGNFARIGVSMDKKEITVFDSRDMGRNIGQLSRGTREQLLLTMRLGFIREYEKTCEPLPLVVDEIFVNFDPERTHKTAEIFEEFACDRQVIIFTCHPTTAGYFNNVNLIEL